MANKISIGIHVNNKASAPIKKISKQVHNFRQELVRFNRNMFTAGALIGTFSAGFRKAMDLSKVGAQFQFVRERFMSALGPAYWKDLRRASRETIDAMSLMQTAVQGYAAGLSKREITQAATLSVGAAKILGETSSQAFKKITKALYTNNVAAFKSYMVNLQVSNQFQILNKVLDSTVKGLGSAGMKFGVFRKMALEKLSMAMTQFLDVNEDSLEILMRTGAAFKSLKQVVGEFIARALAPLAKLVSQRISGSFERLFTILNGTTEQLRTVKGGMVDLIQIVGGATGAIVGAIGGFSLLSLVLSSLYGISLTSFISVVGLATIALSSFKNENESWLEFLGKIGTSMKFVIQAFMSYKNGVFTVSGEVNDRFLMLDKGTQNFILRISTLAAQTKIFLTGMKDGFMGIVDAIGSAASKLRDLLGLTGPAMKFSKDTQKNLQSSGQVAGGAITGLLGLFAVKKVLGGIGSMAKGAFGKRGSSAAHALWVKMAGMGGFAKSIVGLGTKLGFLVVAVGTFAAAYKLTQMADEATGFTTGIANLAVFMDRTMGGSNSSSEGVTGFDMLNKATSKKTTFTGVDNSLKEKFLSQMSHSKKNYQQEGGSLPVAMMEQSLKNGDLSNEEIKLILRNIRDTIQQSDSRKPK